MSEYAGMCVNMPKFAWMAFVLHFFIWFTIPFLFERLQETRGYSLKEYEGIFLKRQNLGDGGVEGRESWYTHLVFCFFFVKTCKEIM